MAIKIAAQGGRLRRQNPTDRDASNIRVNTEAFDALFRTRTLTATAGNEIDYSTINRLADKIASDVQGIEDNRVDAENQSIAANVNKELNNEFLKLASDPTIGLQGYANAKEEAQAKIITKYKKELGDAPSRQYEKLKPHLSNEFEKFRLKLNSDYLNKSKQFIVKTTMKGLDIDKDSLSKATTMGDLTSEYNTQLTNYNKLKGPFFTLNGYGISSTIQDALFMDHSVTAIKRAAVLLLENDDGKEGEAYIASDAKVYYGKEDYTKVNNYVSKEENQKIIADYLGLDLTKQTDKEKFKATISVLREDIKKQDPFVKRENDVFNNKLDNKFIELVRDNNLSEIENILAENPYRGPDSARRLKETIAYVNKPDATLSATYRLNKGIVIRDILGNPNKSYTIFTIIPGLKNPTTQQGVSILEAARLRLIDTDGLLALNLFINTDVGQRKLLGKQDQDRERAYTAVKPALESLFEDLDKFDAASYINLTRTFDNMYEDGIKNNIPHDVLLASDTSTLLGLDNGVKKSIFYNAVKKFKPSKEALKVRIRGGIKIQSDDDILSTPAAKKYVELLLQINPKTNLRFTQEEAGKIFLLNFINEKDAGINLQTIQNAYRRKTEEQQLKDEE